MYLLFAYSFFIARVLYFIESITFCFAAPKKKKSRYI
jgi:hypothetical protein